MGWLNKSEDLLLHISAYILPRRVILALLILLGLFLRLWGLAWPPGAVEGHYYYPEWGASVVDNLSWFKLVYKEEIWTQGFYSMAALLKGGLSGLGGWVEVWLGQARVSSEFNLNSLLAGRLMVALLGTAQIWLAYHVGRRWFDSLGTGLLAAAWLAMAPLMVMESHYLDLGIPLGFISLCGLWSIFSLQNKPDFWRLLLAGLALGLIITFKASGIIMAPAFAWALWMAGRERRPSWRQLLIGTFAFMLGLWLGLTAGSPGFVLQLFRMERNIWNSLAMPPVLAGEGLAYTWQRLHELVDLMQNWVGWHWLILWCAGLVILIIKRNPKRIAITFFPPLYIVAIIFLLSSRTDNGLSGVMPLFTLLAAWPLVLLCRKIPGRLLPAWSLTLVGIILCAMPLLNSTRISYLFWQQPALNAAYVWAQENLPTSPALDPQDESDYYLLPQGSQGGQGLQLVRGFDLSSDWAPAWLSPLFAISRSYEIYARQPSLPPNHEINFPRPPIGAQAPFGMVSGNDVVYTRDEGSLFLARPGIVQRLLRIPGAPSAPLSMTLRNMGDSICIAQVNQGPWRGGMITLYPGQETTTYIATKAWPFMMGGTFPLSVRLHQGNQLWANWQWQPMVSAYQALNAGLAEQAHSRLLNHDGLEAQIMQARTLVKMRRLAEARNILNNISPASTYFELAASQQPADKWMRSFCDFAGYHEQLLNNAITLHYPLSGPQTIADLEYVAVSGSDFSGVMERKPQLSEGWLILKLNDNLPLGHWRLQLWLKNASGPMQMRLHATDPLSSHTLFDSEVTPNGQGIVEIPFYQARNATPLALNIKLPHNDILLKEFALQSDIKAHMRQMCDWYWEAKAYTHFDEGQYNQALQCIARLNIAPDNDLLLIKCRSLASAGLNEQAVEILTHLQNAWQTLPEKLLSLRAVYNTLNVDTQPLDRRLADLRPSISKNARFTGGLSLLGYDWAESQSEKGKSLNFTFYWQPWEAPYIEADIFVEVFDSNSRLMYFHRLGQGRQTMTGLSIGQVVKDEWQLPVHLPPGSYRFMLGLMDINKTRLNIISGEGQNRGELLLFNLDISDQPS